jgi:hypothetical protein
VGVDDKVVVVDGADGGCAGVVNGSVAALGGTGGGEAARFGGFWVSWVCDGVVSLADGGFLLQQGARCRP